MFHQYKNINKVLEFETLSGVLTAEYKDGLITLDLPLADISEQVNTLSLSIAEI